MSERIIRKIEISKSRQGKYWVQEVNFHGRIVATRMTESYPEALETARRLAGKGYTSMIEDKTK